MICDGILGWRHGEDETVLNLFLGLTPDVSHVFPVSLSLLECSCDSCLAFPRSLRVPTFDWTPAGEAPLHPWIWLLGK